MTTHVHEYAGGVCRYCGEDEPRTYPGCGCQHCERAPFSFGGEYLITDPHLSVCGRFEVDPATEYPLERVDEEE